MVKIWIDISHWETQVGDTGLHAPFNWEKAGEEGIEGATIRATYGGTPLIGIPKSSVDAQYKLNVLDAHGAKANVVSYHLFNMRPNNSIEQADFYLANVDLFGRPGMVDFELDGVATINDIRIILERIEDRTNTTPFFYANPSWIKKYIPVKETWIRRFPLILAGYDSAAPLITGPFLPSDVAGWQISERYYAPAYGVQNGNKQAALYEMYDKFYSVPPSSPVEPVPSPQPVPDPTPLPTPDPINTVPALPGPYYILSHREAGEGWFWSDAPLDAYPATIPTKGGNGIVNFSTAWMTALRAIMTLTQWTRTWVSQEGWHNAGDEGTVRQVEFSHNKKWITKINADGSYEYDVYYNSETPPNLSSPVDLYRRGIMTIDYKTGHEATGGIANSDLLLPYISVARDRTEALRIDTKYLKPLIYLPLKVNVKSGGTSLNVRDVPSTGTIITTFPDGTPIVIFELRKIGNGVWGRATADGSNPGWVAMWFTDWSERI